MLSVRDPCLQDFRRGVEPHEENLIRRNSRDQLFIVRKVFKGFGNDKQVVPSLLV